MKQQFWDSVAADYDQEIFNTLTSDRHGRLEAVIRENSAGASLGCDFGCGVGRFLPLLTQSVPTVVAVDFSRRSLEIAGELVPSTQNVTLRQVDLAKPQARFCRADFGICINVMIMPDWTMRQNILQNVVKNLVKGGRLVIVVPSLESTLYTFSRFLEWYRREGTSHQRAVRELEKVAVEEIESAVDGIVRIQGESTKHYLQEELRAWLGQNRFDVTDVDRVEYHWSEDIEEPPAWLKEPYPWDWLVVATRK